MLAITIPDPAPKERRRINANPALSLTTYRQMKAEDIFGFGITRTQLATRLLATRLLALALAR